MVRKYFGTDGIRGRANGEITPELALKVGQAAGLTFRRGEHRHRVVVGKDTRLSGYMIETALVAGFTSVGMDVLLLGPMPTPAVAMLTRSMRADLGVMISASHNPYDDNGIKLFGPDGYKLSDEVEHGIERLIDSDMTKRLAKSLDLGRAKRIDGVQDRYIEFATRTLPRAMSFDGLRIVVDCAHGAAYRVAPEALWDLGAEVISVGTDPDGLNINRDSGTMEELSESTTWRKPGLHDKPTGLPDVVGYFAPLFALIQHINDVGVFRLLLPRLRGLLAIPLRFPPLAILGTACIAIGTTIPYTSVFNEAAHLRGIGKGVAQGLVSMISTPTVLLGPPLIGLLFGYTHAHVLAFASIMLFGCVAISASVLAGSAFKREKDQLD